MLSKPVIQCDPITREENSWLLDFLREMWKLRHHNLTVGKLLGDEQGRKKYMSIYNKLAHEEWRFEQMAKGGDVPG